LHYKKQNHRRMVIGALCGQQFSKGLNSSIKQNSDNNVYNQAIHISCGNIGAVKVLKIYRMEEEKVNGKLYCFVKFKTGTKPCRKRV